MGFDYINRIDDVELHRIGWYCDTVQKMVGINGVGGWYWRATHGTYPSELATAVALYTAGGNTLAYEQTTHRSLLYSNPSYNITLQEDPGVAYYQRPLRGITGRSFTSTAGGALGAEQTLQAAQAGYKSHIVLKRLFAHQAVAAGGTLVIQDEDDVTLKTVYLPAIAIGGFADLEGMILYSGTANKLIKLDTTCANLGNATQYHLDYAGWWEP